MKQQTGFILLFILSLSCRAAVPPYSADYPLSSERFISRDNILQGFVPEGWFSSSEDSLASALVLWLVKEDYTAVLTMRTISTDKQTKYRVDREGLTLLAQISFSFEKVRSTYAILRAAPQEFSLNGKRFCAYELTDGEISKRVVVFEQDGNYYQCEAFHTKGTWSEAERSALFVVQQTVLSSLSRSSASSSSD